MNSPPMCLCVLSHCVCLQNESKPVQMMHQTATFPLTYVPDADCQILELPYVGKDMSMLVMLPNETEDNATGLEKVKLAVI